MVIQVTELFIA